MQIVGVAEVTPEYNLKVDENIKYKLHPGEKVKIKIEYIEYLKEEKRIAALEYLRKVSHHSKLGLFNENITREDAHRDFSTRI